MDGRGNPPDAGTLLFAGIAEFVREATRRDGQLEDNGPPFYRVALGREPMQLGDVEFRILLFLASKPYRPFARNRIAEAVTTERLPVTEATVDQHIAALRVQLGFFRDYVQTVPYLGYRFKP
jgi:DNA-binding response OmpR family regulator